MSVDQLDNQISFLALCRFASGPVALLVGPEKELFYVHEAVMSSSSDFLKNALKPEWKEADTSQLTISSVDASLFRIYVNWLYANRLRIPVGYPKGKSYGVEVVHPEWWKKWCECYELGNFL